MWGWRKSGMLDEAGERLASRLASRLLQVQLQLSGYLNARLRKLDGKVLLALLVAWGLVVGGYCLWLVMALWR